MGTLLKLLKPKVRRDELLVSYHLLDKGKLRFRDGELSELMRRQPMADAYRDTYMHHLSYSVSTVDKVHKLIAKLKIAGFEANIKRRS